MEAFLRPNGKFSFWHDGQTVADETMLTQVLDRCPPLMPAVILGFDCAMNPSYHLWSPDVMVILLEEILEDLIGKYHSVYKPGLEQFRDRSFV